VAEAAAAPLPVASELLGKRISDLGLTLQGSPIEPLVERLYGELAAKGHSRFRPTCYLTDEWGCPDRQPVIGIPFYLASAELQRIERAVTDHLESGREILMYLRHEAGHAFNYAYRLYATPEWRRLFGPFHRRYTDRYQPVPFSRRHVRHIEGWYAQKHPDEDFAETFAVWLTPRSNWRRKYAGWPAMRKLRYVDRIARRLRETEPLVPSGEADLTVDEMDSTVEDFYRRLVRQSRAAVKVAVESDLRDLFLPPSRRRKGVRPAAELVEEHRAALVDKITYWTGVRRPVVRSLVTRMIAACHDQRLVADRSREPAHLVELTVYGTTLAMNYLTRHRFHG
jgi:hypothetical protein